MHQYSFNEEKIIDFIFENKNNIKTIDKTFFYENKIKPKRIYNEYGGPIDKIKDAGAALKTAGVDKLKSMVKTVAKNLVSFGAFRVICKQIAKALNKDPATKKAAFNQIRAKYNDSVTVTSFFLKSTYSIFLMKGYKEFYSWELAMACIMIYESEGISEVWNNVRSFNVNSLEKITEFKEKINSKQLTINPDTTINDSGRSLNTDKDKTRSTETEENETESPQEIQKIVKEINLNNIKEISPKGIKEFFEKLVPKFESDQKLKAKSIEISKLIGVAANNINFNNINIIDFKEALKHQEKLGIKFNKNNNFKASEIDFKIADSGYIDFDVTTTNGKNAIDLVNLKPLTSGGDIEKIKLNLSLLLIYIKASDKERILPLLKEIIKKI